MSDAKYKRVLLKVSGEGLCAAGKSGIDGDALRKLAGEIKLVVELGVEVCVVVGGGNIIRGSVVAQATPIRSRACSPLGPISSWATATLCRARRP